MNIITLLWWSLRRGNPVVPSRWQATFGAELMALILIRPSGED